MQNLDEIELALKDAAPGTVICVEGYRTSAGEKIDVTATLLEANAYIRLLQEDLHLIKESSVPAIVGDGVGDLQLADFVTAREQLIVSREKSITQRDGKAAQEDTEPTLMATTHPSIRKSRLYPGALYICNLRRIGRTTDNKPAKGAIPRAKQRIVSALDLPSWYYIAMLKLEDGKFECFRVKTLIKVSQTISFNTADSSVNKE